MGQVRAKRNRNQTINENDNNNILKNVNLKQNNSV